MSINQSRFSRSARFANFGEPMLAASVAEITLLFLSFSGANVKFTSLLIHQRTWLLITIFFLFISTLSTGVILIPRDANISANRRNCWSQIALCTFLIGNAFLSITFIFIIEALN